MRFGATYHRLMATVIVLGLFALAVYVCYVEGHICEVERERDTTNTWMWVLPYDQPCSCTKIIMGGMNTWTPIRPFKPVYVKSLLLSDDVREIRDHHKLTCDKKDVSQSVTMSASLSAAFSSTELGISSEETLSQTAAKLSTFVRLFYTTRTNFESKQELSSLSTSSEIAASTTSESAATTAYDAIAASTTSEIAARAASEIATRSASEIAASTTSEIAASTTSEITACSTAEIEASTLSEIAASATSEVAAGTISENATIKQDCSAQLGMASGSIPDSSISASSYLHRNNWDRMPQYARLGGNRFWANGNDDSQPWIQVDLCSIHRVTGLQTEGDYSTDQWQYWVQQIKVQFGIIATDLTFINGSDAQVKVFNANSDPNNVAVITLDDFGILTRFIRIYPIKCVRAGDPGHCILRFEMLGCLYV